MVPNGHSMCPNDDVARTRYRLQWHYFNHLPTYILSEICNFRSIWTQQSYYFCFFLNVSKLKKLQMIIKLFNYLITGTYFQNYTSKLRLYVNQNLRLIHGPSQNANISVFCLFCLFAVFCICVITFEPIKF